MKPAVVHWEINAKNADLMRQFYGDLFRWNIKVNNPMNYGLVRPGRKNAIGGGIGQVDPADPAHPSPAVTFYVAVRNPQETLDAAVTLGGRVVVPVTVIPKMVTFAQFSDPEGNVIGLVEDMPPRRKKKRVTTKKSAKGGKKSARR
jgi:hypothetical protein